MSVISNLLTVWPFSFAPEVSGCDLRDAHGAAVGTAHRFRRVLYLFCSSAALASDVICIAMRVHIDRYFATELGDVFPLLPSMQNLGRGSRRERVAAKFVESEFEKIDRLMEIYTVRWCLCVRQAGHCRVHLRVQAGSAAGLGSVYCFKTILSACPSQPAIRLQHGVCFISDPRSPSVIRNPLTHFIDPA